MYLRSVQIENYRAIRKGSVTLDETTVLIGENDCGRSSLIEALLLILGSAGETFETHLKPVHFHRRPDGTTGPLRINLRIAEEAAGDWDPPEPVKRVFPIGAGQKRELDFEFMAVLDGTPRTIKHTWQFSSRKRPGTILESGPEVLVWLRNLVPVLWLRSGALTGPPASPLIPAESDPALAALERHYRNLVTGDTPDLVAELEDGAKAAQEVLDRYRNVFAGAVPTMSAMASDILNRRQVPEPAVESKPGTAPQKIGALLLLGAILHLARRSTSPHGRPVLIIENPESNLHPMTVAAVWRRIERLVWQKIITTNSGTILSGAPLGTIRRLTRINGRMTEWSVQPRVLSKDALRRVSYHLRSRRSSAMFARCWLLVEGETEYWVVPELARICGFDFGVEGVACVEFAQCGLSPLTRLADHLGIGWHVLADGDEAGQHYAEAAGKAEGRRSDRIRRVTRLCEKDIEHCFWHNGFADVIRRIAYSGTPARRTSPGATIKKAIEKSSKPFLALSLIDATAERGTQSVPAVFKEIIESCIALARSAPGWTPLEKSHPRAAEALRTEQKSAL